MYIEHIDDLSMAQFEVVIEKDELKFCAAHFIAYDGFREKLHGHNYYLSIRMTGQRVDLRQDGYFVDFGRVKQVELCIITSVYLFCSLTLLRLLGKCVSRYMSAFYCLSLVLCYQFTGMRAEPMCRLSVKTALTSLSLR